jgi:aminopeptidase N
MLHFLFSDPGSGADQAFFDMMKDFVERHRNNAASTDDFRRVANEHFARSPLGKKYKMTDLNWFFRQWVYNTELPSYKLEYSIQDQPDGSVVVSGNVLQEGVPEKFFMPLPLVFTFGGERYANGTVHAYGPKTPFQIKLPQRPSKVELDAHRWVLSEKTETK